MVGRRLDWMERILRFVRGEMFCGVRFSLGGSGEAMLVGVLGMGRGRADFELGDFVLAEPELFEVG